MSNDNSLVQLLLSQLSPTLTTSYISVSAAVMYYYDCILTFPLEVSEIWTGKFTITKGLYIANRYIALLLITCAFTQAYFKVATDNECDVLINISNISSALINLAMTAIFVLRIYAIFERSTIVLITLVIPSIGIMTASIINTLGVTGTAYPLQLQIGPYTCQVTSSISPTLGYLSELLIFVPGTLFDALVIIFTVYRTARLVRESFIAGCKNSITYLLLRDGLIYYLVMFVPSILQIALEISVDFDNQLQYISTLQNLSAFTNIIQALMLNRLVLNLRRAGNQRDDLTFRTVTGLDPPVFANNSVLGNIGAPICMDYPDDDSAFDTPNGSLVTVDDKNIKIDDIEMTTSADIQCINNDVE